ncbi:MAG TPA: hypothetical protein VGZ22_27805, partial [Isosphaeraceae bacterium]|nr:hypothetical protein [Isosphaeraceae bacterium]
MMRKSAGIILSAPAHRRCRALVRRVFGASTILLALVPNIGCTREFFREWANQDVSEAVFEKSRDPRWRLEMFSVEPPSLARYASPYDPDTPPAPPDDYATQSLSPQPQWPDNRLIVAAEGTGYLDMLEAWRRDHPVPPPPRDVTGATSQPAASPGQPQPGAPAPPAGTRSPFGPKPNSGPNGGGMTPIPVPGNAPASPPGAASGAGSTPTQTRTARKDVGIRLAAFQETNIPPPPPRPVQTPATQPRPTGDDRLPTPATTLDPSPGDRNLAQPVNVRPDLTPKEYEASEELTTEMAALLAPQNVTLDEALTAGLPPETQPYVINPAQALQLGLINSRAYQFQLENVYIASLSVALQRFAFEPQFVAGISPINFPTAAGSPATVNTNFTYRTKEAPGGQASTLNLGTVAGVGKVFVTGGRLLAG